MIITHNDWVIARMDQRQRQKKSGNLYLTIDGERVATDIRAIAKKAKINYMRVTKLLDDYTPDQIVNKEYKK
jgi:hypothetical protein